MEIKRVSCLVDNNVVAVLLNASWPPAKILDSRSAMRATYVSQWLKTDAGNRSPSSRPLAAAPVIRYQCETVVATSRLVLALKIKGAKLGHL